jgi:regulation of enolase protein 1 (concanavalin A-like superfamily)
MATASPYRSAMPSGRDGFGQLLRAEWTKLRSVPRWVLAIVAAVVLTVSVSLLSAADSGVDGNQFHVTVGPDGQPVTDDFHFVHQPMSGDGSVTARVLTQVGRGQQTQGWAKAGVMIKEAAQSGSPYAAMMVTPGHGVRLQSNFTTDEAGSPDTVPRWLRLTRSGTSITGYESADGNTWSDVGSVELDGLPTTVEVGLFVASPDQLVVTRTFGSVSVGPRSTFTTATFDHVSVDAAQPQSAHWTDEDVRQPGVAHKPADDVAGSSRKPGTPVDLSGGSATWAGDTLTVTGTGDIAPNSPDEDLVSLGLSGVPIGLMAIVAVGVLFATSEYKRAMIRTTFAASPRRGRVLAAKAVVLGVTTFCAGLIAAVTTFLLAQPILRSNGYRPPAFPQPSLSDWPVLRAVVGTAALLAVIAVFSLGVGAILRRSAGPITGIIVLLILPTIVAGGLPLSAARWLTLLTPTSGFAIMRAKDPTTLAEPFAMISPWAGFGVVCAYAAGALAVATWLLGRRDA